MMHTTQEEFCEMNEYQYHSSINNKINRSRGRNWINAIVLNTIRYSNPPGTQKITWSTE
jgi:hypothetical protein